MNTDNQFRSRILPVFICVYLWLIFPSSAHAQQVRGVSLAHLHRRGLGYGSEECRKQIAEIKSLGANWIAINDFAYMGDVNTPEVRFGGDRSMKRENLVQIYTGLVYKGPFLAGQLARALA